MTTTTDGQLNEVDLNAVGALVEAIKQDPSAAQTTWSAEVRWTGAFRSVAAVRGHAPIASDEPAGLGGTDRAPNPVEQLLGSLVIHEEHDEVDAFNSADRSVAVAERGCIR